MQQVVNRYDAAGNGRRMRGWMPPSSGPNKAITGIQNIRNRARDSVRNDWSGASGVRHWTTNLIGTGIVPRLKLIGSKERKKALVDLWDRWCRECDADGTLDFYGLQTLFTRSWMESGECFIRLRPRRSDSGMEVPLQVQLIEADFVPQLDADNWPGMPRGNRIRCGIELDRIGRRVAYWVYKEHPGDGLATINSQDLVRVPKSQMLHVFEPKRPGQLRGVPEFAAVLARLRDISDYDSNVLEKLKVSNLFAGFITRPGNVGIDDTTDPLTGLPIVTDSSGSPMVGMEPGTMQELAPGESVAFANPPEAGTMYHEYMRTQNMSVAAGWGLPNELMSGDIKEISDRTLRVLINEFRRFAEQRQWQIIIPQACQPIRDAWVQAAVLVGQVSIAEMEDVKAVQWAPQGWPYIHPVQDVQAKETEVQAGFRSRSSVIGEKGDDPDTVDEERQADKARADEMGLTPVDPAAPDANEDDPESDGIAPGEYPRNRALDNLTATVARLETVVNKPAAADPSITALAALIASQQESNAALMRAFTEIAQALVNRPLNVTNEISPTPVEVSVAAPNVQVTNDVNPTPVEVNVASPNVQVTNEVQPAAVTVDVNLPERETTSVIERDREGNIVNVTQTEKTLQ